MVDVLAVVILACVAGMLTVLTIAGNAMVIIAFKVNKKLRILSNYCLVSLAVSDITVGIFLMPVYTVYVFIGYWPFGRIACNIWLSMDYALCTASVTNLLVIALDRYLIVKRPLEYKAKITSKKMKVMIALAWTFSLLIWPPWIFAWPYIEGVVTVGSRECYVQFLQTNPVLTTLVSVVSFYIPVTVTVILYVCLYAENLKQRRKRKALTTAFTPVTNINENLNIVNRCTFCPCFSNSYKLEAQFAEQQAHESYQPDMDNDSLSGEYSGDSQNAPCTEDSGESQKEHCLSDMRNCNRRQEAQYCETSDSAALHKISISCCSTRVTSQEIVSEYHKKYVYMVSDSNATPQQRLKTRPEIHHNKRLVKILSATLLSLIISNAPYYTLAIIGSYCNGCVNDIFYDVAYWLCYINSTINPLLYALCNANFQNTFLRILRCRCK